jgi:hypothetical protein
MVGYTKYISERRLCKHIPVETDMSTTIEELCVFYVVREGSEKVTPSRFCKGICEERAWAGDRAIAIVWAVTRKHLVKRLNTLDCVH